MLFQGPGPKEVVVVVDPNDDCGKVGNVLVGEPVYCVVRVVLRVVVGARVVGTLSNKLV